MVLGVFLISESCLYLLGLVFRILSLKKCCRVCLATVLPLAIAIFVISVILSVGFMMIVISGMKEELNILKLRMENGKLLCLVLLHNDRHDGHANCFLVFYGKPRNLYPMEGLC